MKRITLFFVCLFLSCAAWGQNSSDKTWLSVSYNNNQYGSIVRAPFDDLLSVDAFSVSVGLEHYLGKSFDIGGNISVGKVMSAGADRADLFGFQVSPRFKLNNGKILSDSSRLSPYIAMGLGIYAFSDSEVAIENDSFFTFSPTIGLGYRLGDRSRLWASAAYKINSTVRYREYAIGVSFSLARKAAIPGDSAAGGDAGNSETWLTVAYNNNQYGSIVRAPFDDLLSVDAFSVSVGIERYLGKSFDIGGYVSIGKVVSNGQDRADLIGFQVAPKYKLNNGKILSESSKLSPYLALGLGLYDFSDSEIDIENGTFFTISPAVGLEYHLSNNLKLGVSTAYKINSTVRYREYSVGLSFSLKRKTDTDGDGIPDRKDDCPNEFGTGENNGCAVASPAETPVAEEKPAPVQEDITKKPEMKETVKDSTQVKPTEKPVEPVKPVDTDQDGVADADDQCPNEKGSVANGGCPVVETPVTQAPVAEQEDIYQLPIEAVSFAPGTAQIRNADLALLDQLAALMASDESFKIELNGYGDGQDAATDFTLASRRVAAVKAYLVAKGRSPYRFISNVFGRPADAGARGKVLLKVIN